MPTGTPGHFSGGAKAGGQYDTATQTFRKPAAKAAKPSKGGFAGATSQVRPLTPDEHHAAAEHLASGGHHHAAAHHRSAAEQMQHESTEAGQGDADQEQGMYGNNVKGSKPKLGSGDRFKQLSGELAHKPGVDDPKALAASIGRKKYGAKKMGQLSHHEG